jgi:hypothetical protein
MLSEAAPTCNTTQTIDFFFFLIYLNTEGYQIMELLHTPYIDRYGKPSTHTLFMIRSIHQVLKQLFKE